MTNDTATLIREAASKLLGLRLSTVYGEPNADDAEALGNDLKAIVHIVLPVIRAQVDYVKSVTGADVDDVGAYLEDALNDALGAISRRAEELEGEERERASRSYQRASFAGV